MYNTFTVQLQSPQLQCMYSTFTIYPVTIHVQHNYRCNTLQFGPSYNTLQVIKVREAQGEWKFADHPQGNMVGQQTKPEGERK